MQKLALSAATLALVAAMPAQGVLGSFPLVTTNGVPVGLDAGPGGSLFFTDIGANDEIGLTSLSGTIINSVNVTANTGNPIGITRDGMGNVYVTDTIGQDVDVYDSALNFLSSFSIATQTTFPEGIAYSSATGNLYVVDGTAANVFEYDTMGTFIAAFPILGSSVDGIAHDAASNTFWVYDSGTDSIRNYDAAFTELRNFPGTAAAGFGTGEGVAYAGNIVYVCATGQDTVVSFGTRNPSLVGTAEATLNSTTLDEDALTPFEDNWFIRFNAVDPTPTMVNTGLPFVTFINLGAGAPPATGVTSQIPGFIQTWPLSTPVGPLMTLPIPNTVGGMTEFSAQVPPGAFSPGDEMRVQGLAFDPMLPGRIFDRLLPSNAISFRHRNPVSILISCTGDNSFNSVTTSGYFSVQNVAALDITSVVFDWVNSSNPAQATMVFDTDQAGMADLFEGGNSTTTGCLGTFRNGSDVATGLVYDAMNTINATPCDPAANAGWIGTNPGNFTDDWRTLEFRFAAGSFVAGQTFEFDCDTDGGAGIGGDDMAGMVVTITLSDGTVLTGEVAAVGPDLGELAL